MTDDKRPNEGQPSDTPPAAQNSSSAAAKFAPATRQCPVIGIGASAGGLEALSSFFSAIPTDCGMIFVVIQHLSPSSQSLLPELLRRDCEFDIVSAEDYSALIRNRAYVIPPNHFLVIERNHLRLQSPPAGPPLPIDHFLRTLASERGELSAAVILSGTGTDGTLGLRAIKGEAGLVLAQSPETTEHSGMPQSAIDTGLVDFVLSPAEMPRRLIEHFRRQGGETGPAAGEAVAEEHEGSECLQQLQSILARLRERRGHDFSGYKSSTIVRRVGRRMAMHDAESYADYLRFLDEHPEELDVLFNELLIRVSAFFRDSKAFEALRTQVIPRLFEDREEGETTRIWVPGCSTGEEAYSIAILIREWLDDQALSYPVQIFATDIDAEALRMGRVGRYPANIVQDVSAQRLKRFFTISSDDGYQVKKSVRDMVAFAEQSVTRDPPFSRLKLVSCRNMLIYMGNELQKRILPLFHYALAPGGYLFLGTSESLGNIGDMFRSIDPRMRVYQREESASWNVRRNELPMFLTPSARLRHSQDGATPAARKMDIGEAARGVLLREHTPACVIINSSDEILYFHGATDAFLAPGDGPPSVDIMRMARKKVSSEIRMLIQQARSRAEAVRGGILRLRLESGCKAVRFVACPTGEQEGLPRGSLLLLMETVEPPDDHGNVPASHGGAQSERVEALEWELASKEEALQASVEELETSNEELQSSNEELQSSNEELQSTNEELETSREELQTVNEELHTVNAELESNVEELARARDDINNLLSSSAIGIIFLDEELRVQRYTSAVTDIVPLIQGDIGRPLSDIGHKLDYDRLITDLHEVLQHARITEREVHGHNKRAYLCRLSPYRASEREVRGVVITFIDLAETQRVGSFTQLVPAIDQSPEAVVIVDLDGPLVYVNRRFCAICDRAREDMLGESATALGLAWLGDCDSEAVQAAHEGKVWRGEVSVPASNGRTACFAAKVAPVSREGETTTYIAAYLDELTKPDENSM